ncbi:MAG: hypothetical protein U1E27_08840 [Kiritimatiellia bacterium]|nr:hypothetical protein [Kiritimatiellia bacterium]
MKKRVACIVINGMTVCAVFIVAVGCATRTIYLEGRRAFPVKPKFTITPREYTQVELAEAGVRTDGVYVDMGYRPEELRIEQEQAFSERGWRTGSPYIRFWANGRVMGRLPKVDYITAEDADSFERARIGYFHIPTNGIVEVERYMYHSGLGDYTYRRSLYYIEGETLWLDLGRKHKGEPIQLGYRFVPVGGMRAQPDW